MGGDPRVQELVEELIDSGRTPEEVCRDWPELLPPVRELWCQLRTCDAQLDLLFPPPQYCPPVDTLSPVQAATDLPRIPGYEVQELLGRGGMGVVFRARHLRLNRTVALKMALAGVYADASDRERFRREAEAVAGLRHPNVVQIYDVGDSDGRPYFTMEFIEGGSLAQKLAGTPLPARQAGALLAPLADAVQAAHQSGIVHRDLKPANILLSSDGAPKVSDFGLARRLDGEAGLTRTGAVIGTPSYMAPEQAAGKSVAVGPAVDVYALGAILYEMLTGRPPFRAETAAETIHQVINQDPVPPSRLNGKVPRDLETVCLKCLRKAPRLRYASAAELAEDLRRFQRGEAVAARPERWYARLARRVARRPGLAATLGVAVASAGGGVWVMAERAAATRAAEAERAATERAAADDLQEMVRWEGKSSWAQARAALDRAKARLGERGSDGLRRQLDRGDRDLTLAARLDDIRLGGAFFFARKAAAFPASDQHYQYAFREAGLGQVDDPPELVAARVKESDVRETIVAALDDWAACVRDPSRRTWMLTVARLADPDATDWRDRARDPAVWDAKPALFGLIEKAPIDGRSVPLLLALEKHLHALGEDPVPFLKRIQTVVPDDYHLNFSLGRMLYSKEYAAEAVGYFRAALGGRPRDTMTLCYLGCALRDAGQADDALEAFREGLRIEPAYSKNTWNYSYLIDLLTTLGRHDEAMKHIAAALQDGSNDAGLHEALGRCLEAKGRSAEAIAEFRRAVECDPKRAGARMALRGALMKRGRMEEVRAAWAAAVAAEPPEHEAWDGYAELCLFLGNEGEYRRVRRALLARFGGAGAQVAERTGRACLLAPGSPEEIAQAAALVDRALSADKKEYPEWAYPYFLVAKGLADYRSGRFADSANLMRGEASKVLIPAPQLVLAMDLYRLGRGDEARAALAGAVLNYDWRSSEADNREVWMYHALRREAERMLLPNLPAFLEGKYQPRSNDERLALIGACQFHNRFGLAARLYADAFAADPRLEEDFGARRRYGAARMAALAGCGRDEDAARDGHAGERLWRTRARQWLRADLAAWIRYADGSPADADRVRDELQRWRDEPDLAGLRKPAELDRLSADERADCLSLWKEVDAVFKRKPAGK